MTDAFTVTRIFNASRELVYSAWTTPEHFSVWFGTQAVDVPLETLSLDVRVGGTWSAVMHLPDGNTIDWVGEYAEVNPPSYLAFTMADVPSDPSRALITVSFTEVDDGTEMTLTQPVGGFTPEQVEQTILGYNGFFDAMESLFSPASS